MEDFDAPGLYAPAELPPAFSAVQSVVVLRLASAGFATAPTDDPPSMPYEPRLLTELEIGQTALDALGFGGRVGLTIAEADLWNADRQLDGLAIDGIADGREITVRVLPVVDTAATDFGSALGSAGIALRGIVRRVEATGAQSARISIADIAERLATPLQSTRYAGSGGTEGPAELAGRAKPVCLGTAFNVLPIPLGSIDLGDGSLPTYQVHWRAVEGTTAVRIRGVEQTPADPPGGGEFKAWDSLGLFQLGGSPDGIVTADVQGDQGDAFVSTTAGILRRMLTSLGPQLGDGEIQAESWSFAETDLPGAVGWYRGTEEVSAEQAAAEILAATGATICGGRNGTLRLFDPLGASSAQFALPAGHIIAIEPLPLPAALRPLPRAVAVEWLRNWTPQTDLAGSVPELDRARFQARAAGPYRAESDAITLRVLLQRELRLPGLYYDESDAQVRAERWRQFLEASPRGFRVMTDRYLGQIECGDVGWIGYPAFGLNRGAGVVVLGWREGLAARRITLDLITVPWVAPEPTLTLPETDSLYG